MKGSSEVLSSSLLPRGIAALSLGFALTFAPGSSARAQGSPAKAHGAKEAQKGTTHHKHKGDKAKGEKGDKSKAPRVTAQDTARAPAPAEAVPLTLSLPVERVTLENGLRVVLNVDHSSPTVAIAVTYDVGSRDEDIGRTGFAHLFEHMMFQGSRNLAKGDHFRLVTSHGGQLNGTTSADRTNYFEVLPSNELALGLWLEADRMKSLDVNEENFENQRKVVQEEYRMRVSNAAYAPSEIRLEELVYKGYFPYEHSTIGSMADLDSAKLEWVQDFYAHNYGPNNAVLSISGDVDPANAMELVRRYFGSVPRIQVEPRKEATLPEQTTERTDVVHDDNARSPGLFMGFQAPPGNTPDYYALSLAALILGEGESSRLHQLLVRDRGLAQTVDAGVEMRRGPSLFEVESRLAPGAKPADVESLIDKEIATLATRGPSEAEVQKAHRKAEARLILGLQSNLARARELGQYEVYFGDAKLLEGELARYVAVTRDDVQRVTAKYLVPSARSVVETLPTTPPDEAAPQPRPAHAASEAHVDKGGTSVKASATKKKGEPSPKAKKKKKKG